MRPLAFEELAIVGRRRGRRGTYSSRLPGWAHTLEVAQALEAKIQREGEGIA
jgi:hypothetical protein